MNRESLKNSLINSRISQLQNSTKKPVPSLGAMAKNVGQSVVRNFKSVAAGNNLKISDQEAAKRLEICKGCQFFNTAQSRCNKCGCFMAIKTYLKAEKCPIGRW